MKTDKATKKLFGEDYAGPKKKTDPDTVTARAIKTLNNLEPVALKAFVANHREQVQALVEKLMDALG